MRSRQLLICAVGDVAPRRSDPATIFADTAPWLRRADLCFGQMECPISDRGSPNPQARLAMRTGPEVAPVLRYAGFDVMSVAGNHALDFGPMALADTLTHLQQAGIAPCGGGANLAEARQPALLAAALLAAAGLEAAGLEAAGLMAAGQRVAVLAYSSILPAGYAADATRPGCAPLRAHTHYEQIEHDQPGTPARVHTFAHRADLAAMSADIRAARQAADVVLISIHWGIHFVRAQVADYQREIAHAAIAAGADALFGHHPHLLKGVEFIAGKPVFYSLGNFAIEQPAAFDEKIAEHESFAHLQTLSTGWQPKAKYQTPPETRHTMIAWLDFSAGNSPAVRLQPCRIDDDAVPQVLHPDDEAYTAWLDYMLAITAEAGLNACYTPDAQGMITCAPAPPAG